MPWSLRLLMVGKLRVRRPGVLGGRLTSNTRSYYRTHVSHYAGVFEQWKLRWEHGGRRVRHHQAGHPLGYRPVTSVDGTRLRSWSNEGRGVPVMISNGLGT